MDARPEPEVDPISARVLPARELLVPKRAKTSTPLGAAQGFEILEREARRRSLHGVLGDRSPHHPPESSGDSNE